MLQEACTLVCMQAHMPSHQCLCIQIKFENTPLRIACVNRYESMYMHVKLLCIQMHVSKTCVCATTQSHMLSTCVSVCVHFLSVCLPVCLSNLSVSLTYFKGRYHEGRRRSSDHSPAVIPPSALNKPSIMKRYHRRRTTR